jgi:hypothetical protein
MLRCERKEGKVFFAFGSKGEVSSTAKQNVQGIKEIEYITRYVQIYISFSIIILQRPLQNFLQERLF